jgi:hypothetical protein
MKKFYRGSYIDASCQVWLHLGKQFQRRRFFLTLANQKQELPLAAIFVSTPLKQLPNGTKLGRTHLYKVLYKVSSFHPIPPTNMAAKGNSCF